MNNIDDRIRNFLLTMNLILIVCLKSIISFGVTEGRFHCFQVKYYDMIV